MAEGVMWLCGVFFHILYSMKPLRFIHIAKTGGQSIAKVAKEQAGLSWGMYDTDYGISYICHRLLSNFENPDIIDKHDWFMVVRNPYERMVSHYNWHIQISKKTIGINEYLHHKLENGINQYLEQKIEDLDVEITRFNNHFTAQHLYLEYPCSIRVLRYENLENEFNALMKEYGHSILLNRKVNVSVKTAFLSDLTLETIELINRVYEKDFTTFGYEMVHSGFQKPSSENSASVAS